MIHLTFKSVIEIQLLVAVQVFDSMSLLNAFKNNGKQFSNKKHY
jgi:hypothetical protein